jgi:hypothetical protein
MDDISKGEKGKLDLMAINKNQQNQNFGICSSAHEVLKALPGMDELKARKLIYGVVNTTTSNNNTSSSSSTSASASSSSIFQVKNLNELCQLSERDLKNLFGPQSGSRLFRFLHDEVDQP